MATSRESVSDRNLELNRPSSSYSSTSQNVQSKNVKRSIIKGNESSPFKSPNTSLRQKHEDIKYSTKTNNVLHAVNEVSGQLNNVLHAVNEVSGQLNNVELDTIQQRFNAEQCKHKNAKKKERLKSLQMPSRNNLTSTLGKMEHPTLYDATLQEYFANSVNPLYAIANPNYLQNLRNHPQFQFGNTTVAQNLRGRTISVPSTPLMQIPNFASFNISRSPGAQSAPNTPGFLHNVMQHPLLSQTVSPKTEINKSPKHKNNKKMNTEDTKFEPYMLLEEVEVGLKNNTLFEGVLRINPKQYQNAYVSGYDRDEQDIYIDGMKYRNRALEGDIVIVQYIETPEVKTDKTTNKKSNIHNKTDSNKKNSKERKKRIKKDNNNPNDKEIINNIPKIVKSNDNVEITEINDEGQIVNDQINNKKSNIESQKEINIENNEKIKIKTSKQCNIQNNKVDNIESNIKNDKENNEESNIKSNEEVNKHKRGKVVYIKERVHKRMCIGHLKLMPDKNRQKAFFIPRDHRIPRLNIAFSCWPDNFYIDHQKYENTLFLASIEDWYDVRFAIGKIICNIGQSGDMVSETKAILAQNDLDVTPFGPEVKHLYPCLDTYTIPKAEIDIREDCRSLCIFSIDPSNCRDIDDAVSCRQLENGNYEVGIHISDVAHYLAENTILDEKVSEKATTIYLVERAYHMLPDDLCMLCSLFPGVDKLAFSIFWEISDDAIVLNHRICKTVINSCCQLSYDHAQAVLEDKEDVESIFPEMYNGFKFQQVHKTITILGQLASILRKRRFENGALRIDQPKISFKLNAQDGLPESFFIYESRESHQLIEEFMLLANMYVARRLFDDYPDIAFLRSHPPPSSHMLKYLAKILKTLDIDLKVSSAADLQKSLMEHIVSENRGKAMVLNMLCAKPMSRAKYFCAHGCNDDDFHHYALNVPLYTHFTSPIRRYADIMVHRLLAASINFRNPPDWKVEKVSMVAAQCNKQKYNAKRAGEMSTEIYTLKYIELNSPVVTEAVVVEIREKYLDIIVPSLGLNRKIFFNKDFPGEIKHIKHQINDAKLSKMELKWNAADNSQEICQTIEIFSIIKIALAKGDGVMKIDTLLLKPECQ
ncbi:hypothetical protein ACJJTC_014908 [Scirpophaga incertulas]